MSVHVEWLDAAYTTVGFHAQGDLIGEHTVDQPMAVSFGADEVVVIQGEPERLEKILSLALATVRYVATKAETADLDRRDH